MLLSPHSRQRKLYVMVLSICLSVCRQAYTKTQFSKKKLSNLELWSVLRINRKSYMGFLKNPFLNPKNSRWRTAVILKIVFGHTQRSIVRFQWNFVWNWKQILPRDAMHGLCCRKMSERSSVCPSHAVILSKRLHISSKVFHHRASTSF